LGLHITTHGWIAYGHSESIQQRIYMHSTVICQHNSVDLHDGESMHRMRRACGRGLKTMVSVSHIQALLPPELHNSNRIPKQNPRESTYAIISCKNTRVKHHFFKHNAC